MPLFPDTGLQLGIKVSAFKPTGLRFHEEDVVIKPLSDSSLWFETCLIMRAEDSSRAVNVFFGLLIALFMILMLYRKRRLKPQIAGIRSEVLATHGHRTSPVRNLESPIFADVEIATARELESFAAHFLLTDDGELTSTPFNL